MITVKTPNFNKILTKIKDLDKDTKKAFYRAQNKGVRKFRTEEGKEVRKIYTKVKKSDVTKATKLKLANMSNLNAQVRIKGNLLSIQDSLLRTKRKTKKGTIKVNIKNNTTKALTPSGNKPFLMTVNGKTIVMQRKTKKKYPLKQIKTLSIPQMLSNIEVSDNLIKITEKTINDEFDRLLNFKGEKF